MEAFDADGGGQEGSRGLRAQFGGSDLTGGLHRYLRFERACSAPSNALVAYARGLKQTHCEVPLHGEGKSGSKELVLPDGKKISVKKEIFFNVGESMFDPLPGADRKAVRYTLPGLVGMAVNKASPEVAGNIVVTGGASMMKNFPERFESELATRLPSEDFKGLVLSEARQIGVWKGACILASTTTGGDGWLKRYKYQEEGPSAIHRAGLGELV